MLSLVVVFGVGLWGADAGVASRPAGVAGDPIARISATLVPLVQRKGAQPVPSSVDERMRHYNVPGVSVAIVDGGVVWARGFGLKTAGTADRVTATTLFQAASISKAITATATLRLVERGKLSLDADINSYLRAWKLPDNAFTVREKVTLRRILSHSAGLTVPSFRGYAPGERIPTLQQILDGQKPANTDAVRVDTVPGSICRYSGGGILIEQIALTDVTGKPFPALLEELVFAPLGMADSTFEQRLPPALRARAATAHDARGTAIRDGYFVFPEMAAAGLWTTPSDLLRWAMEIAAARAGRSTKLLSQAMATQMLTVQKGPLGLGPFLRGAGAAFNFGHPGWNLGFHSKLLYFPERGQGAVVMANGDGGGRPLVREILNAIAVAYDWPGSAPMVVEALLADATALDRVVGTYEGGTPHPITVTATVSRAGGKLFLDAPKLGIKTELVFTAPRELVSLEAGDSFSIVEGNDGRAKALVFGDVELRRIPPRAGGAAR